MHVYVLQHVRHARNLDGTVVHTEDGELACDEQSGDDVKLLGVYSSDQQTRERIERARHLPGFVDEPDCFVVTPHELGEDYWNDGFVTIPHLGFRELELNHDVEADAVYVAFSPVAAGEVKTNVVVAREGLGEIVLDFDEAGFLQGIEIVGARRLLRALGDGTAQ